MELLTPCRPSAETILVVDDEETNLRVFEAILRRGGFATAGSVRAERAAEVRSGLSGRVPLAVIDVKMPVLSGVELARQFAAADPALRVLFVSGTPFTRWTEKERCGLGELGGSCCLLPKPFVAQSFLECVRCLLRGDSRLPFCPKHGLPGCVA